MGKPETLTSRRQSVANDTVLNDVTKSFGFSKNHAGSADMTFSVSYDDVSDSDVSQRSSRRRSNKHTKKSADSKDNKHHHRDRSVSRSRRSNRSESQSRHPDRSESRSRRHHHGDRSESRSRRRSDDKPHRHSHSRSDSPEHRRRSRRESHRDSHGSRDKSVKRRSSRKPPPEHSKSSSRKHDKKQLSPTPHTDNPKKQLSPSPHMDYHKQQLSPSPHMNNNKKLRKQVSGENVDDFLSSNNNKSKSKLREPSISNSTRTSKSTKKSGTSSDEQQEPRIVIQFDPNEMNSFKQVKQKSIGHYEVDFMNGSVAKGMITEFVPELNGSERNDNNDHDNHPNQDDDNQSFLGCTSVVNFSDPEESGLFPSSNDMSIARSKNKQLREPSLTLSPNHQSGELREPSLTLSPNHQSGEESAKASDRSKMHKAFVQQSASQDENDGNDIYDSLFRQPVSSKQGNQLSLDNPLNQSLSPSIFTTVSALDDGPDTISEFNPMDFPEDEYNNDDAKFSKPLGLTDASECDADEEGSYGLEDDFRPVSTVVPKVSDGEKSTSSPSMPPQQEPPPVTFSTEFVFDMNDDDDLFGDPEPKLTPHHYRKDDVFASPTRTKTKPKKKKRSSPTKADNVQASAIAMGALNLTDSDCDSGAYLNTHGDENSAVLEPFDFGLVHATSQPHDDDDTRSVSSKRKTKFKHLTKGMGQYIRSSFRNRANHDDDDSSVYSTSSRRSMFGIRGQKLLDDNSSNLHNSVKNKWL